jgi:NhaA family Na+:H+ antiporter
VNARPGLVLMAAAAVALIVANTGAAAAFEHLWTVPLPVLHDLRGAINDGLMTIFFFTVGIEIRHELQHGALHGLRRAALPLGAALGGMLVPAALYLAFNHGGDTATGWGIPVATDIAFAVGVLTLLAQRAPATVRPLLLALAVVDDVGAILIITIFYAGGVHPTLAGVVLGLVLPTRVGMGLARALAAPVAYGIMPLFALANAGVALDPGVLSGERLPVFVGVAVGLVAGKPLGVLLASRALVAARAAALPDGLGWSAIGTLGTLAGIGFTMSLFIAQLAFPEGPLLAAAKLGIVVGSVAAAGVAVAVTSLTSARRPLP